MLLHAYLAENLVRQREAEVQAIVRNNWLLRALRQSKAQPAAAAAPAAAGLGQTCACTAG